LLRLFTFLKPPLTDLFLFLGYVVKWGPNLEDLRIIIFVGAFVQVLLMVGASASVFWIVVVVGARDASGFPVCFLVMWGVTQIHQIEQYTPVKTISAKYITNRLMDVTQNTTPDSCKCVNLYVTRTVCVS